MKPQEGKPIGFAQLCAIARSVCEPLITDAEWKERIKARLVDYGFEDVTSEHAYRAIRAVQRHVLRLVPAVQRPAVAKSPDVRPLSREEAAAAVRDLERRGIMGPR